MPRPTSLTVTYAVADADGVCASQTATATGGSNLTINGALATGGVATMDAPRHVSITATGNNAAKTFTVTGTDRLGNAISEAIPGPNGTTVKGSYNFNTITTVAINAASAGTVTVGSADEGESQWIPTDRFSVNKSASVDLSATAALTYSVQHTNDDLQANGFQENDATAYLDPTLKTKTADEFLGSLSFSRGIRLKITGHTAGSATLTLVEGNS